MRKLLALWLISLLVCMIPPVALAQATGRYPYVGDGVNAGDAGWDVRAYAAKLDGSTADTTAFNNCLTAAAGETVVIPAGTMLLDDNVTVAAGITLQILDGGIISIASTKTLTINGTVDAGLYQIFSGAGSVSFGAGAVPEVYPQWWGAIGDDSTDNSAAFNAALGAVADTGTVYVPIGIYRLSVPIDNWPYDTPNSETVGVCMRGASNSQTILKYMGTSGYAIEMDVEDEASFNSVNGTVIQDLQIQAPDLTSEGGGVLLGGASHNTIQRVDFHNIDNTYGIAVHGRRRNVTETISDYTADKNLAFTSGGGARDKIAVSFTMPTAGRTKTVSVTMRKVDTGALAGTIKAALYTNSGGLPSAQVEGLDEGGADWYTDTVNCTSLVTAAAGGSVTFTWTLWKNMPGDNTKTSTYWIVFETSGYTYSAAATEVQLRVDEDYAGGSSNVAVYDGTGGSWSDGADGANAIIVVRMGQCIMNNLNEVRVQDSESALRALYAVKSEDDTSWNISQCQFSPVIGIWHEGGGGFYITQTQISTIGEENPFYVRGSTAFRFVMTASYVEGGASATYPCIVEGGAHHLFAGCILPYMQWDEIETPLEFVGCSGPLFETDDPTMIPPPAFQKKTISGSNSHWALNSAAATTDADALDGNAIEMDANADYALLNFTADSDYLYTYLPSGTYLFTAYVKDTNQVANNLRMMVKEDVSIIGSRLVTLTADYEPYEIIMVLEGTGVGDSMKLQLQHQVGVNTIYISHVIMEYLGPDLPFVDNAVLYNSEASDGDGDRVSRQYFVGRQSGEEQTALASISASHDGASDDEKGKLEIATNDGDDSFSPTVAMSVDSNGDVDMNYNFNLDGILTYSPSSAQVIDAVGDTILADATRIELNPDANYTLTSTPHVADGTEGDVLVITAANNEGNSVTLQDQDTLAGSNMELNATTRAITGKTVLILHFDGSDWVEINYGAAGIGDILKDLVAGNGLTGGADDVLPGADSDVTVTVGAGDGVIANADEIEIYGLVASDGDPNDALVVAGDGDITVNYNAVLDGIQTYTTSSAQVIDAVGDTILQNATRIELNPDANYTLTSTPHIADGTKGDLVIVTAANNEGNSVTLQDQDTLGGSNVQLGAATRAVTGKTALILQFDGSDWIETNYGAAGLGDILKDLVAAGTGMSGGANDVFPGADADVTITLDVSKDLVAAGTGMSGGENDVFPGADADVTITLDVSKDIVVSGTGMSGGENDVLPGAEADVTIALDVSKDIVAGDGLTGGEDDVLPGADADTTLAVGAGDGVIVNANEVEVYGLVASDGNPTDAVVADADGHITVNYNLTIDGVSVITPSTTQVIDAAGDAISADATLVILNPDADYTLTSTPTIANGTTGQILFVTAANAEGFGVTIQDQDQLGASNVQCKGDNTEVTGKTIISFIFDGTDWIEYGAQDVIKINKQTIVNELNIPHSDDPTTDSDTELAYDTNDEALEVYDGADSRLIPTVHSAEVMIFAPDQVNDEIPLFHVDAEKYPHGIELLNVQITIPADAAYAMVFEEWAGDPPAAQNDIETVSTGATDSYMEVRTGDIDDNDIDADDYIFLDIPATDVDWILCGVYFYINDGN